MTTQHVLYRFYDTAGELLYVGVTVHLPNRLTDHRHTKPWWTHADRITLEHYPTRAAVLEAERTAIQKERPKWNVVHNRPPALTRPPATRELRAEDMPDDCHDGCVRTGLNSVYYPHKWADGIAHYQCQNGHTWTCGWGWDPTSSGRDDKWAGTPVWSMMIREEAT